MMKYDVTTAITYACDFASDRTRSHLRLVPLGRDGQQIVPASILTIDPLPHERRDRVDYFGNLMTAFAYHEPVQSFSVTLRARVIRQAGSLDLDLSPELRLLPREFADLRGLDPHSPLHFRAASPRVPVSAAMTEFAGKALRPGMTVAEAVMAVGESLHRAMQFDPEATRVDTAPEDAFASRRGVCQDFTHIMIAGLRGIGIPAGYVSGYIRTLPPPGAARLEGADAMHAWVRAWCGFELGWVDFDPTNNMLSSEDHIQVAFGRDYGDVAPVRGAMKTSGAQVSRQTVDVVPHEEPVQPQPMR